MAVVYTIDVEWLWSRERDSFGSRRSEGLVPAIRRISGMALLRIKPKTTNGATNWLASLRRDEDPVPRLVNPAAFCRSNGHKHSSRDLKWNPHFTPNSSVAFKGS